jgi:hypothetical protein
MVLGMAAVMFAGTSRLVAGPNSKVPWFVSVLKAHVGKAFCTPASMTVNQAFAIVEKYAKERGIDKVTEADVCAAISKVYPCPVALSATVASLDDGRHGKFHSYDIEAEGNLKPTHALGCVDVENVSAVDTPVDLFNAAALCAQKDDYKRAAALVTVGTLFGRFDIERVSDKSSHDAVMMLRIGMASKLTKEQVSGVEAAMKSNARTPGFSSGLCAKMSSLGPPQYRPDYMIRHGMNAFTGGTKGGEMVAPFDAREAWTKDFQQYLLCTVTAVAGGISVAAHALAPVEAQPDQVLWKNGVKGKWGGIDLELSTGLTGPFAVSSEALVDDVSGDKLSLGIFSSGTCSAGCNLEVLRFVLASPINAGGYLKAGHLQFDLLKPQAAEGELILWYGHGKACNSYVIPLDKIGSERFTHFSIPFTDFRHICGASNAVTTPFHFTLAKGSYKPGLVVALGDVKWTRN